MDAGEFVPLLRWQPTPGAATFDVVFGDLDVLRIGGEFSTATTSCVVNDHAGVQFAAPAAPGDTWYLVRPNVCQGAVGSYDTGAENQAGPRDAGITSASGSCP